MPIEVLDPTYGEDDEPLVVSGRLSTLQGMTIGIVSNGKQGTRRFFDAFADRLKTHHGAADVHLVTKQNYSAPAGDDIINDTQVWNALIAGIGD